MQIDRFKRFPLRLLGGALAGGWLVWHAYPGLLHDSLPRLGVMVGLALCINLFFVPLYFARVQQLNARWPARCRAFTPLLLISARRGAAATLPAAGHPAGPARESA